MADIDAARAVDRGGDDMAVRLDMVVCGILVMPVATLDASDLSRPA